jgi:hypothetical protein
MIEADVRARRCCRYRLAWCARPTGDRYVRTTDAPAQRFRGAMRRPRQGGAPEKRGQGHCRGWGLHLASLQRGSLILREDCYNVVTRASTVGNDCVAPDSKRERGGHARYALLGTRSALGSRRTGHCGRTVPIGPPLALAARCGPGLTHRRLPRPVNGERWAG